MSASHTVAVGIDIRLIGKQRTGDETVFFQLVRELIRRQDADLRYELYTDETADDKLAALRLKLEALGRADVDIVSLPASGRFFWNAVVLPWRLFRHPVDIFHTQYILPLFLPARLKVVTHIHDVSFRAHPEWIGWVDRFFLSLFIPRTMRRSEMIIAPSMFTREEILKYYHISEERVVVIENAAAEEWFQPIVAEMITRTTSRYGLIPGRYLISSGTLQPRKNIPFLIDAFLQAVERHNLDYSLVLTGNPSGHNVDPQITEGKTGRIVPVGYVSDVDLRALVAGAVGYVFPSLYEGFGIPIEEALAVGTPVLASDIPVFREVGGARVRYFDPYALAPLAENLYTFSIAIPERRPENKPFSGSQAVFSWKQSALKLALLYRSLVQPTA